MSWTDDLGALPLVDHHVHGATRLALDRAGLEAALTESDRPAPAGTTQFDSQVGFAVRRWCAPVLDLEPGAPAERYVARRAELGPAEVNRRFLRAAGVEHFLVETGYAPEHVLGVAEMAELTGAAVSEVVRLESVAEEVARAGGSASSYADRLTERLAERTRDAVGVKSIVAYRYGFDFDPAPPDPAQTVAAAGGWLAEVERTGRARLADVTLLRHVLWAGVATGLPLQLHVGYGDPDLELHRCDPALLTGFLRLVAPRGTPVMLLHCYPFHRQAGYLAQAFPHVFFDVGLAVNYTGARAAAVVAESLELAPFGKVLFSSDAWGPAELHYLGAHLWRRAMGRVLGEWVDDGEWPAVEAGRVAAMVGRENARRVYRLDGVRR